MEIKRIPQHNTDIELSVLCACILYADMAQVVTESLKPESFYKEDHGVIFEHIIKLVSKNKKPDMPNLVLSLKKNDSSIRAVDIAAITTNPLSTDIEGHCAELNELYKKRVITQAAYELYNKSFQTDTSEIILDDFNKNINNVDIAGKEKITSLKDGLIDVINDIEERCNNKDLLSGLGTGFRKLDSITGGLQPSDLIILAARPSMGKTTLALNIASYAADFGKKSLIFSYEMSKKQLQTRELVSRAKINSNNVRNGQLSEKDWGEINYHAGRESFENLFIYDQNPDLLGLCAISRRLKRENDISLIIIEYLKVMPTPKAERNDLSIGIITRALKILAKELDVPIILLSQLNRALEQRVNKRPIMSDLRASGNIEQDADLIAFIYRDEVYNKEEDNPNKGIAEILIEKHRNGEVAAFRLAFLGYCTKFENIVDEY